MSFLRRVAGRSLRDRVRSSVTREELRVEPLLLHVKRSQLKWLGHLFRMPPGRLPGEVFRACPLGGDLEEDPGHAGGTMGSLGLPAQTAASATRLRMKRKKMDGWMDGGIIFQSHRARAAARAPRGPRLEAGPGDSPAGRLPRVRVMLLLVVSCDLPLQLMYGPGAVWTVRGLRSVLAGVMTLATLASTAENRSKTLMRVELLYGLAGLVGSLFSGHLFLFKTQSLGQGIVLLIVSTFLAALCLLDAVFLLQVTDVSQAEVEPESYGLIPPAAPTDTPIQRNIPNIALLFTAAVLYSSAVGGAVNVLGAFVLNKPLSWDATQVGYGNAAGCLIFITSYLGLVTLRPFFSEPV
ncbi:hypothetical protein WMY93_020709 [Mugilogobius chulae]|uniref:Solute carrier family 40 protein n=1 Tax=Mugilogobius chulae TaxID=88201 RepID=A0AAW0NIN6_9GOBI